MKTRAHSAEPGIPGSASSCGGDRNINVFISQVEGIVADCIALERLDVGLIADRMCMSRPTLYRRMTEHLGMGTREFIRIRRLEAAASRLKEVARGDVATVNDISFACGFSSQAAFAKAFKKHFGLTATEFIERNK